MVYQKDFYDGKIMWCWQYDFDIEHLTLNKKEPYKCIIKRETSRNYPNGGWFIYEFGKKENILKSSRVEVGARRWKYDTYELCLQEYNRAVERNLKDIDTYTQDKVKLIELLLTKKAELRLDIIK